MERILIIEDEESILMALEDDLKLEGYKVTGVGDGQQGLSMAKEGGYDLIILDIMLPKMNGFEVCKELRQAGVGTPILMLTAKSQEIDKVLGLELGADDYVTKPFSPRELLARVKAILRRAKQTELGIDVYRFGDVELDFKKYEAAKNGAPIYLTRLEFALLQFLIKHKDQALSRDTILDEVWGKEVYTFPRTVDTHIAHLRKKIEDDPANPSYILGVRGVGYKFRG
ncbi:response regulator transcription factor [Acidobacteria bacterium AH-259-O06]|nr:response regulator transcription factor [Acidobacteria bacterium AH-259-O06]